MKEDTYIVNDCNVVEDIGKTLNERGYVPEIITDRPDRKVIHYKGNPASFGAIDLTCCERYFGTTTSTKYEIKIDFIDVDVRVESRLEEAIEKVIKTFVPKEKDSNL